MRLGYTPNGRNVSPSTRMMPLVDYRHVAVLFERIELRYGSAPFSADQVLKAGIVDDRGWVAPDFEAIELRRNTGCPIGSRMLTATTDPRLFRMHRHQARAGPAVSGARVGRMSHATDCGCETDAGPNRDGDEVVVAERCHKLTRERDQLVEFLLARFDVGGYMTTSLALGDHEPDRAHLSWNGRTGFGRAITRVADATPPESINTPFIVRLGRASRDSCATAFTVITWGYTDHVTEWRACP